ncbi:hypothetical protein ACVK00_004975 [Burkholderia sp. PvR073]|nr:nuclear transport factor 2 family protein [Burkholderia sp. lyk4-R2A-23]
MTPLETIDRLDIQDLLTRYCHAVDRRDWNEFERLSRTNRCSTMRHSAAPSATAGRGALKDASNRAPSACHFICMS